MKELKRSAELMYGAPQVVKHATISPADELGHQNIIVITMEDDSYKSICRYYTDELRFSESEFVGLTEDGARNLCHQRDVQYLQS